MNLMFGKHKSVPLTLAVLVMPQLMNSLICKGVLNVEECIQEVEKKLYDKSNKNILYNTVT